MSFETFAQDRSVQNVPVRVHRRQVGALTFEDRLIGNPANSPLGGLIFAPDWYGVYEYPIEEATRFARAGFCVLVVDLYGEKVRPNSDQMAERVITELFQNPETVRVRMTSALAALRSQLGAAKVACFGFSFGGWAALQLAASGAELSGVVVLSAASLDNLGAPGALTRFIPEVLVLHGTQDQIAPIATVIAFAQAMDAARNAYRVTLYGGAHHAFTNAAFRNATAGPLRYAPAHTSAADDAALAFLRKANAT